MSSGIVSIPIESAAAVHSAHGFSVSTIRLWVKLSFERHTGPPLECNCLLDSGAPLSLVPFAVHNAESFVWQPVPGPWPLALTRWLGVPCEIGEMDVWLPTTVSPHLRGPFRFIAKFALATPPSAPSNMPILLGLNFLADHLADTSFQCYAMPHAGEIVLP